MDSKQGKRETNRRGEIMLKAVFSRFGEEIELTGELWQYDFGQKIQVTGIELPDVCEVHFQYDNLTETKTVTGYKQEDALIIDIPNEALTSRGIIKLYIYLVSSEEGRTVNVAIMHVNRRMKPEGFEVPEDIDLFHHTLLAAGEYMQQTKSAKKSAETAANQAESAKNAAEAAAGSAQASADEAKTSKENAETAAKVAEAFKTETETAKAEAVQAAADATAAKKSAEEARATAEKAKQDAETAKAETDADKEATEAAQAKAEAAQKAAENAEAEAKKAQTATETARRETETAKAAVETMQSTVAGYADNAKNAKEAAETAKAEVETAKNDAAQAKEAAEKAKTGTATDRETAETASKVAQISATSAEESAKKAEAAKEEIQESADQIQKNTEDIAGLEETVSTAGISVTEAGTGIVVPECTGGKLQGLKMYGKSEQVQYSGKNLFNVSDTTNNILVKNGIKINEVDQQNGIIKAEFSLPYQQLGVMINSSANTTYTLSFKQKNSKNNEIEVRSYYVKNDVMGDSIKQVVISSEEASFTFTVLNDSYIVVYFRPKGNYSSSDTNVCEFTNIQLERNASSTDFEPYVGGKPSPSPDYPQEIKYVENPTLMIHTKNIVKDVYVIETTTQYSSALLIDADIQGDTEYMLSFIAPEGLRVYVNENLCSYKLIKGTGKIQSVPIKTIKTISKDNVNQFNANKQKWILLKLDKDNTVKSKFDKVQLEKGNVATVYKPYNCKTLILPYQLNAIPVSSDGNYTDEEGQQWVCDEIDFERGMYIQRVGIQVGIDGFQETNSANSDMSLRIVCNMNDIEKVKFTPIICNKLRWEKKSSYTDDGIYISTSETALGRVCVRVEGIKTMEEYQEILADMQYFYILATPIETPLTAEEINAYKSLYTYDGTTIIDNDAGCYMEATVPQDTKYYIDSKIAELSAAIVASASEAE